jgi:hypothetical protein
MNSGTAEGKQMLKPSGGLGQGMLWLLLLGMIILVGRYICPSPGTFCEITRSSDAVTDLNALDAMERARNLSDHYGWEELEAQGRLVTVPPGTHGLLLERSFRFGGAFFYRKVRLLSGADAGKAVWVSVGAIQGRKPTLSDVIGYLPQSRDADDPAGIKPSLPQKK